MTKDRQTQREREKTENNSARLYKIEIEWKCCLCAVVVVVSLHLRGISSARGKLGSKCFTKTPKPETQTAKQKSGKKLPLRRESLELKDALFYSLSVQEGKK